MNDWYIDRSKNFVNDTLDSMLQFLSTQNPNGVESKDIVDSIQQTNALGNADANPNAALTRLRDHGLLKKNNVLGDSAKDYINHVIDKQELIIDLFLKRPAKKSNSPNVKPFVLLCVLFDAMLEMKLDPDDIFITFEECKEYLYPIDSYSDVTFELVEKIIREREYDYSTRMPKPRISLESNEDTNISIWFNALKETPVFMPMGADRRILRPNIKQSEFFRYISVNADEFSETPTTNNNDQYNYYCDRKTGLAEVIPNVINCNVALDSDEVVQAIFEYLFGYKKLSDFNYRKYLKYECFGILFPFITIPKLAIRDIGFSNTDAAKKLLDFTSINHGYLEAFTQGAFEYKGSFSRGVTSCMVSRSPRKCKLHALNQILYGAPGTGKTYATAEYAIALLENRPIDITQKSDEERSVLMKRYREMVQAGRIAFTTFHQSYGYEDFIQGLRPDDKAEGIKFIPVDGVFKRIADMAMRDTQNNYVIIIDEINRANISKVFGELITLMEDDKRWGEINQLSVTLPSGQEFAIPNNLYIIGTMNSADKSISLIDTALRRRFEFVEVTPNYDVISDEILKKVLIAINDGLVKELDSTDLLIGHAYFIGKTEADLCNIMNRNIIPLLYEYFFDNSKKVKKLIEDAVKELNYIVKVENTGRLKFEKKD